MGGVGGRKLPRSSFSALAWMTCASLPGHVRIDPVRDLRVHSTAVRQSSREESILGVAQVLESRGPGAAFRKKTKEERTPDGPVTRNVAGLAIGRLSLIQPAHYGGCFYNRRRQVVDRAAVFTLGAAAGLWKATGPGRTGRRRQERVAGGNGSPVRRVPQPWPGTGDPPGCTPFRNST